MTTTVAMCVKGDDDDLRLQRSQRRTTTTFSLTTITRSTSVTMMAISPATPVLSVDDETSLQWRCYPRP